MNINVCVYRETLISSPQLFPYLWGVDGPKVARESVGCGDGTHAMSACSYWWKPRSCLKINTGSPTDSQLHGPSIVTSPVVRCSKT